MAYSYVAYTGNGSTTQFALTFTYIRREHVKVYINNVDTAYTWINNSLIQLASAPVNGSKVEVRRVTPLGAPLVDFADNSALVAADLDTANLQQLYLEQELYDSLQRTVSIDPATGLPSAGNQRIVNVANPVNAQDAATKSYVDTQDGLLLKRDGTQPMGGNLSMDGNRVTGLGTPTAGSDAVTKDYADVGVTAANQAASNASSSASAAQASASQAATSAATATSSASSAATSAAQAAALARRSVFVGFARTVDAALRMTYSTGSGDTSTYATSDFTYKGVAQWAFLGEDVLAITGNNVGVPRFSLNSAGHLILEI